MPLELDFRNILPSASLSTAVQEHIAGLERLCNSIIGCHVTIELPPVRRHQADAYSVQIAIAVPGSAIIVGSDPGAPAANDAIVAIDRAFGAAQRQLEDYVRDRRGDVVRQATQALGGAPAARRQAA